MVLPSLRSLTGGGRQGPFARPGTSHGVPSPSAHWVRGGKSRRSYQPPTCRRVWFLTASRLPLRPDPFRPCSMPVAPLGLRPPEPCSSRRSVPLSGSGTVVAFPVLAASHSVWNPAPLGWPRRWQGDGPRPRLRLSPHRRLQTAADPLPCPIDLAMARGCHRASRCGYARCPLRSNRRGSVVSARGAGPEGLPGPMARKGRPHVSPRARVNAAQLPKAAPRTTGAGARQGDAPRRAVAPYVHRNHPC